MRAPAHAATRADGIGLGLRQNLGQFLLLVAVNALVGAMVGQERTVVPLLGERVFGLASYAAMLTFIAAFGLTKAVANLAAGVLADRWGRKPLLVAGWVLAVPVPLLLIWAPTWGWVIAANVLLGVNQGFAWSATVIMKIDLAGPQRRGLAMGLNEAAGYVAVAAAAWATGAIAAAHGLRPAPFLLGLAFAGLGLGLSVLFVRETSGHAAGEIAAHAGGGHGADLSTRQVFALATWRDRSLAAVSRAGLVNNLNEGVAWGLLPLYFAAQGLGVGRIGLLSAVAPAVWGAGQLATGWLSDRTGRKWLIAGGQWVQAAGLAAIVLADSFAGWLVASAVFGAGTAMAYPTLLAAVGDLAHPGWRGAAVGVYRLWRDVGFAVGAVVAGLLADAYGVAAAVLTVAAVTALSGLDVTLLLAEPRPAASRAADTARPSSDPFH